MNKTPGVFILEPPSFPPSVVPVETAIPAFIGFTEKNPNPATEPLKPVKIFNLDEFADLFGKIDHSGDFTFTVNVILDGSGAVLPESIVVQPSVVAPNTIYNRNLYHALRLYFSNGGGPCYIVSVGLHSGGTPDWAGAIESIDSEDDPTLIVMPELVRSITSSSSSDYEDSVNAALMQCLNRKDRFVIIDVPQRNSGGTNQTNVSNDMNDFRTNYSDSFDLNARKFGAAYYPNLETAIDVAALSTDANGDIQIGVTVNETTVDNTAVPPTSTTTPNNTYTSLSHLKGDNNYDGIYQQIVKELRNFPFIIPPSSAVAGVYAKVDSERGVFKAPANVTVASVISATAKIDDSLQGDMNVHPSGKSVNPIRTISNRGMVVWGARTLDANNLDFRYINVRRFFNFVEESVKKAMYRFVFEPNTANTWTPIRAAIENFLTVQWEAGALQGAKADDAFFVEVGLGQTMAPIDIVEGNLKVRIGMAVARPAEFIILEFIQILPQS